nr:hypothetical protein Iba_scaffold16883CG0680 [Ipomoea batatas]
MKDCRVEKSRVEQGDKSPVEKNPLEKGRKKRIERSPPWLGLERIFTRQIRFSKLRIVGLRGPPAATTGQSNSPGHQKVATCEDPPAGWPAPVRAAADEIIVSICEAKASTTNDIHRLRRNDLKRQEVVGDRSMIGPFEADRKD